MERIANITFALLLVSFAVQAQTVPQNFTIEGRLFDSGGAAINTSADILLEVLVQGDVNQCVFYRDTFTNVDLTSTDPNTQGVFALRLGASGASYISPSATTFTQVFSLTQMNGDNNRDNATDAACTGVNIPSGTPRLVRVSVRTPTGVGGYTSLSPDTILTSTPTALVADSVRGYAPSDFIQVRNDNSTYFLGQGNIETVFNSTNWPKLQSLLAGTSGDYMDSVPGAAVSFNNQRLINVANPTGATDVANKQYVDGNIAGYGASIAGIGLGIGGGSTLVWDQVDNRWEVGTPIATDNTKLPLAGGTMTGGITMSGQQIYNVGHITMADQNLLRLGSYTSAQEGLLALGTANAGTMFFNSTTGQLRVWNGTDYSGVVPGGVAGGDLTGAYPSPTIANNAITSAKINDGAVSTADIGNSQITSAKINNTGIAVNRILITDATTGGTVTYANCAQDEILKFNSSTGWGCSTPASLLGNTTVTAGSYGAATSVATFTVDSQGRLTAASDVAIGFPVTSVAGRTGAITLNTGDVNGLGTAATYNVGTGSGQIPVLDGSSRLPAVDGGFLTNVNAQSIQTRAVSSAAPADGQVLRWNNTLAQWEPSVIPSAPVTSVNGKTGTVTIELADIAGAGDITGVNAGNGLLGGATSGIANLSVNAGTGANQIVQIGSDGLLPVIDGSNLTNLNALRLQGRAVSAAVPADLEVLQWNATAAQWAPVAIPSAPVSSVNGKTGIVTIELADIAGAGDITQVVNGNGATGGGTSGVVTIGVDVGTGANQIVQLNGSSQLPAVNGSLLTNVNAMTLQNYPVAATLPISNQVLTWNGSVWMGQAIPSAPVSSVNGKTGIVTIELADIAGAGDITGVNAGNGLLGGATSGIANLSVNAGTGANQIVQIGSDGLLPVIDGSNLTNLNALRIQGRAISSTAPAADQVLRWNGSLNTWEPQTLAVSAITALTGDVLANGVGSVAATISNNAISSAKINDTGIAVNRLLMTDSSTGGSVTYASCAPNELLKFNASTGWGCATLSLADVSGAGDITEVNTGVGLLGGATSGAVNLSINVGNGANQIVQIGSDGLLPAIDGSKLTNLNALRIQGRSVSSSPPAAGETLTWNNTFNEWRPTSLTSLGLFLPLAGGTMAGPIDMSGSDVIDVGSLGIGTTTPSGDLEILGNDTEVKITTQPGGIGTLMLGDGSTRSELEYDATTVETTLYVDGVPALVTNGSGRASLHTNDLSVRAALNIIGTTDANSAIVVPRASTSNRPSTSVNGMIRFNTSTEKFEVYQGLWQNMIGGSGSSGISNVIAGTGLLGGGTSSSVTLSVAFPMTSSVGGTSTAPAYSFAGDSDNGMFSPAINQLAFSTTGSQRMLIDGNGRVGIGTSSLNSPLNVSDSRTATTGGPYYAAEFYQGISNTASAGAASYSASLSHAEKLSTQDVGTVIGATNIGEGTGSGGTLSNLYGAFNQGLQSSGLVGSTYGAYNQAYTLNGNLTNAYGAYNSADRTSGATTTTNAYGSYNKVSNATGNTTTAYGVYSEVLRPSGTITTAYGMYIGNVQATTKWSIYANDATAPSYFAGKVALGTTTPTAGAILDLNGTGANNSSLIVPRDTTALRPTTGINGMIRYNTTTQKFEVYEGLWQNMISAGGGGVTFPLQANPSGTAAAPAYSFSGDADNGMFRPAIDQLAFSTAGTQRIVVDSQGNVGVGIPSSGAKLDVAGEVRFGNTASACNASSEGQQRYNNVSKYMEYCNGTTWIAYAGTGGGNVSSVLLGVMTTPSTITASSTFYFTFGAGSLQTIETQRQIPIPRSGIIKNFFVTTGSAQPASGGLVATIRINGSNTPITFTINPSASAGTYSNTVNNFSVTQGDLISISLQNQATGASAQFISASLELAN